MTAITLTKVVPGVGYYGTETWYGPITEPRNQVQLLYQANYNSKSDLGKPKIDLSIPIRSVEPNCECTVYNDLIKAHFDLTVVFRNEDTLEAVGDAIDTMIAFLTTNRDRIAVSSLVDPTP